MAESITVRISVEAHKKLRMIYALTGKHMKDIVETLIDNEYKRVQQRQPRKNRVDWYGLSTWNRNLPASQPYPIHAEH